MKFVVAHTGARHGYAVPTNFARAKLLDRFYTDICGSTGLGKWLAKGHNLPFLGKRFKKLANRRLPSEIQNLTYTYTFPILHWSLIKRLSDTNAEKQFQLSCLQAHSLGERMVKSGFGEATHLYSMLGEFSPLLPAATRKGLGIISDVYILLSSERILLEEAENFPEWGAERVDYESVRRSLPYYNALLSYTDIFICPSKFVQEDLVQNFGVEQSKTTVVPYGLHPQWLELQSQPKRGRILFVGTANLRKGVHYLAMAAQYLYERGYRYEFRIAGDVTSQIKQQPVCQYLTFLGRIPRDRIHEEFAMADIFVLPTLAEGSAGVTYEALGAGIPVVTTAAAGSVVRDSVDGYIVPERNPLALAEAIANIVEDRAKREKMAIAARERAKEFVWERYGERLIEAIKAAS